MYIGDDFHHNGAFRLMYAFSWLAGNARTRAGQTTAGGTAFSYGTPDGYRFFMEAGAPARVDSLYFQGQVPAWNDFMRHPDYDQYWKAQNVLKDLGTVPADLPILNVAGWFDAEQVHAMSVANLHGEFCTAIQSCEAIALLGADARGLCRVQGNEPIKGIPFGKAA